MPTPTAKAPDAAAYERAAHAVQRAALFADAGLPPFLIGRLVSASVLTGCPPPQIVTAALGEFLDSLHRNPDRPPVECAAAHPPRCYLGCGGQMESDEVPLGVPPSRSGLLAVCDLCGAARWSDASPDPAILHHIREGVPF